MTDFDALVSEYSPLLTRYCYSLCKNSHDAQDLFQETWLRAVRFYGGYDASRGFDKWLLGICHNCFIDMCRRKKRRGEELCGDNEQLERFFEKNEAARGERGDFERLYSAVGALKPKLRAVVSLRYFSGYDDSDIAAILGISYGAAKTRLSRALKALERALGDERNG